MRRGTRRSPSRPLATRFGSPATISPRGHAAGFDPSPLFDAKWYLARHGEVVGDGNPLVHYIREGWRQAFDPHPLFSVRFYLDAHPDVSAAGCEPLAHYLRCGGREGRAPCEQFDGAYYLEHNADVAAHGLNPLRHFVEHGAREGRNPSADFDTRWYAEAVLKGEAINPLVHFRTQGSSTASLFLDKIRLSADYAMSQADFARWTDTLAAAYASQASLDALVLVRSGPPTQSAGAAQPLHEIAIGEALEESRRFTSGACSAAPAPIYLFCAAADEIDTRFLGKALETMGEAGRLAVFDIASKRSLDWVPVLLPGANAAHIEAVDRHFLAFHRLISSARRARSSGRGDPLRHPARGDRLSSDTGEARSLHAHGTAAAARRRSHGRREANPPRAGRATAPKDHSPREQDGAERVGGDLHEGPLPPSGAAARGPWPASRRNGEGNHHRRQPGLGFSRASHPRP